MPIAKVKAFNVRGGAEAKGPANAFAKFAGLGGASSKQQALDAQQARDATSRVDSPPMQRWETSSA